MPHRVQRSRAKGWRMPANTVYVGRGSAFGNPFIIGAHGNAEEVVEKYRQHVMAILESDDVEFKRRLGKLVGRNLACWCRLDSACHGDFLLDLVTPYGIQILPVDKNIISDNLKRLKPPVITKAINRVKK